MRDVAKFSLWDEFSQRFRQPTKDETRWIMDFYKAEEVIFSFPTITIKTKSPPEPLPLTVACVAVQFLPSTADAPLPLPASVTTYANPRLPDPIKYRLQTWRSPSKNQKQDIITALVKITNVRSVTWLGSRCFVELRPDGRHHKNHSLPGYVAGKPTVYYYAKGGGLWGRMANRARSRAIDPGDVETPCQDTTNYLQDGIGQLQPGVRLANSLGSRGPSFADKELSTTCGVRLKRNTEVVVTGANHGPVDCDDVYHPSTLGGAKIGEIVHRWPKLGVAMMSLIPAILFTNNQYFQANMPIRLLRSDDLNDGTWCSADGMSTGLVFFQCVGTKASDIEVSTSTRDVVYRTEHVLSVFGPVGKDPVEGICGAPIVEESCPVQGVQGGVASFFHYGNENLAVSPVLDELIDAGWELY